MLELLPIITVQIFVKENHRYRIDWDDSVYFFRNLGAEDKVRVKTFICQKEERSKMHREMHLLYRVRSIL